MSNQPPAMNMDLPDNSMLHRLSHGVLFHPAPSFDPGDGRPVVAIISHLELFPALHGFRVVVLQLAEVLKAAGYCTIWVNQAKADGRYISSYQAIGDRYFDATFHIGKQTPRKGAAKGDFTTEETLWCLRWIEERFGISAAIAEYAYMAPCLSVLSNQTLKLVQMIDVVSRLSGEKLRRHHIDLKRELTRDEEIALLRHVDVLMAITQVERDLLLEMLPDKKVITVGYSMPPAGRQMHKDSSQDMLMLASSNPFNRDGAITFIKDVLPKIRSSLPDCRLLLAGQVCDRLKADGYPEMLTAPGVVSMGPVDDVEHLYESAAVAINPTRLGTGLKIKTVEAIAAGMPIVTTTTGCEGLPRVEESPFVIADDADAFAAACIRLLRNVKERHALQQYTRAYTENYFSMNYVYEELRETLACGCAPVLAQCSIPNVTVQPRSAPDMLKALFREVDVHVLEIGYPSRGMIANLAQSIRLVRYDSLPPIASIEELDYQWMKNNCADEELSKDNHFRFHRLTPEQFLSQPPLETDYNMLYLHGEHREERLLRNLLSFTPFLSEGSVLAVDGYGDVEKSGVTRAVDNFVFLALPDLSDIICVPFGIAHGWPLHRNSQGYTILIRLKSCVHFPQDIFPGPELAVSDKPLSKADIFASRCLRLLVRERLAAFHTSGVEQMALFGAGAHTTWLENACEGLDLGITVILDDNPDGKGPFFGLNPVRTEAFLPESVNAIVLSSDCRQREMALRCRHIYGDGVKLIDLYEGLPPGPYAK